MYRVRGNVNILANKVDGNDDKIMNVLHIVTNAALRKVLRGAIADNNVTRCTTSDLIGDVAGKAELAVVPADFDLRVLSALHVRTDVNIDKCMAINRDLFAIG